MGSSKKKHKEKDREHRHRNKSSSSSSSKPISGSLQFDNSNYYEVLRSPQMMTESSTNITSSNSDQQQQSSVISSASAVPMTPPKPPPLRMILKVPQSAPIAVGGGGQLSPTETMNTTLANSDLQEQSSATVGFFSSVPPNQSATVNRATANSADIGSSPFISNASFAASNTVGEAGIERKECSALSPAPLASISMESMLHGSDGFTTVGAHMGNISATEMESSSSSFHHLKKAKKSKKGKKSKHKKHKRHHHHHHHHHHNHSSSPSSSSLIVPNMSESYQLQQQSQQFLQSISSEVGTPSLGFPATPSTWMSTSASFSPFSPLPPPPSTALPFSSQTPQSNSLNTSFTSSIESDHLDFLANLSPGENSNLTNSDTNINQPTTPVTTTSAPELNQMKEHVSSEVVSSSTSSTLFDSQYSNISSPANGPAEIKLKLSKNLFTSQYSSTTVTQSPVPDNSSPPQLKASSSPKMLICSLQSAPPHIRSLFTTLQHLNKNVSASLGSLTTTTTTTPSPNKSELLLSPPPPPQAQATTLLTVPNDHHQHHHHLHHQPIITSPSSKQSSSSRGRNRSQSEEHQQLSSSSSSRKVHSSRKRPKKGKPEKDFTDLLLHLLRQIKRKDAQNFFLYPVTDAIAPGYSALITTPMDLTTMQAAIEGQKQQQQQSSKYLNLGDFIADVKLICDNAMKYNHPDTVYYKAAAKLWHFTNSKLTKKEALVSYAKNYAKCTPLELSLTASSTSSSFHRLSQPSTNQTLFDQKSSTSLSMHTSAAVFSSSSTGALPSFSTLYPPTSSAPAVSSSSSSSLAVFGQSFNPSSSSSSSSSSVPTNNNNSSSIAFNSTSNFGDVSTTDFGGDDPFSSIDLLSTLSPFRLFNEEENAVVSTNSDTQQQLSSYLPDLQYEVPPNSYPAQQLPPLQPPPALPVEAKEKRESEMTTEEMVASIQASARKAAENLRRYRGVPRLSYLSENPNIAFSKSGVCDGSVVVLNTLCTGDVTASSKPISLKHLASTCTLKEIARPLVTDPSTSEEGADKNISAEQQTTKELQTEEAEEKTNSKPATESTEKLEKSKNEEEEEEEKEDSLVKKVALEIKAKEKKIEELRRKLIPAVYEDDDGLNYALSISRFTRDIDEHSASNRIIPLALNKLTTGKHRKSLDTFNKLLLLN